MDARITKQRLANMLAYDWLKIIGTIALATVFFCVFFMMIATRPTAGQSFYIYAYDGLSAGGDFNRLEDDLKNRSVFAYDILDIGSTSFTSDDLYGTSAFTARRASGEGRVMFISDARKTDDKGKESSDLLNFLDNAGTEYESFGLFIDPEKFMEECEAYLKNFFGKDVSGEPNAESVRAAFLERNGKDKRYRTSAKKEAGVKKETERLTKLKKDFLTVKGAIESGAFGYVTYTGHLEKVHTVAFSMKSLNVQPLVFYTVKEEGNEVKKNDDIALCIFNNGTREGDLKYETVNFLAYLLERYNNGTGTAQ